MKNNRHRPSSEQQKKKHRPSSAPSRQFPPHKKGSSLRAVRPPQQFFKRDPKNVDFRTTTGPVAHSGKKEELLSGEIRVGGNGNGYFRRIPADPKSEIEVQNMLLHTALNGDEVEIRASARIANGKTQGEVVRILHRHKMQFVGVLKKDRGALIVVPDDSRMYRDILIDQKSAKNIAIGMKVLARITAWEDGTRDPRGEVLQAIGAPGEHETEVRAIALDRGFDGKFPKNVEDAAAKIPDISEKDFEGRKDFRKTLTFTIDPKDAKDFDDALSWKKLPNGNLEIGVHIADVSYYVRPKTVLDIEAARRATSVYLVDRTIPMLPERLSNELCSLKPDVDRLTFSAVFEMKDNGTIVSEWYGKGIIHSARRFTYEEAQEVIEKKSQELAEPILSMDAIAKKLRQERILGGAVEFQSSEVRCELDKDGKVIRIYKKEMKDANKLIEEFMLLANRKVTEWVAKTIPESEQVFVYRIHGEPNEDKIRDLEEFVRTLGITIRKPGMDLTGQDINQMLAAVEHKAEKSYIHIASIRAMAKAIYSTKNIGHFGLGFHHYTHFTSPIRRYPDTMVHRLLDRYLRGEKVSTKELAEYERMARYSTEMEISASEAERASIRYKQVEYWADKVGAIWTAKISGVAQWGIFVEELETGTEGMIHVNDLLDDTYVYEETKHRMVGQRNKKVFRLGDPISVRVRQVDQKKRLIGLSYEPGT